MNITGNFLLCVSLNYYIKYLYMDACILQNILEKKEEKFDKIITKNNGEKMKEERAFQYQDFKLRGWTV